MTSVHDGGRDRATMAVAVLFGEQEVRNKSIASFQARTRQVRFTPSCRRIAAAQRPAVQEESDLSAKRSGAAMYAACFWRRGLPRRDAAVTVCVREVV